jgi:hypothetical protein
VVCTGFRREGDAGRPRVRADLPGIDEKDLDGSLTGNRLVASGKREAEEEQKGETWSACERSHGSFTRSFTLPEGIDTEHVRASLDKGAGAEDRRGAAEEDPHRRRGETQDLSAGRREGPGASSR